MIPVLIVLIVFSFVIVMVKMGMDHDKEKMRLKYNAGGGESMRMSELQEIVRQAVLEANEPLHRKLELMERRMNALPPHEDARTIANPE